ncbi:MAG: hypothetical protein ABH879_07500 [archaeon]
MKIIERFEKRFEALRNERKFKSTLAELDEVFYLRDMVAKDGYVSADLSKMICSRIAETYLNWSNYLHGLIMPNPGNLIAMTESDMLEDSEKEEINMLLNRIMAYISRKALFGLKKDSSAEPQFIDDGLKLWNSISPKLIKLLTKISKMWGEKRE